MSFGDVFSNLPPVDEVGDVVGRPPLKHKRNFWRPTLLAKDRPDPNGSTSHFQEQEGGVYVQLEAISLTRDIPDGLGWLIRPFVTSIPRESLVFTLDRTRKALN